MKVYTLGHSTRTLEDFVDILKHYNIQLVVDVRKFPSSKKFPHFNKENLETELPKIDIHYIHYPELGGYRKEGYEAFSRSEEFSNSLNKLLGIIDNKTTAIMCAEWNPMKCHRWYISETLFKMRYQITHIIDINNAKEHQELPEKIGKIKCDKRAKRLK